PGRPAGGGRPPRILLRGRPGVGKTTVVVRLAERLRAAGVPVAGFLTREVRAGAARRGFLVESLDGRKAVLADVGIPGPVRVGRYGVDVGALERVALPALLGAPADAVVLVDELGKMELASERFRAAVGDLLERPLPVVATVHVHRHPFTDALLARADVDVVEVTPANRDRLPGELAARLRPSAG
ncbi:MAG TPA: NTPase, partial [Actinomycetota bacterium]|nr:NTPase [Actinomycetota bacterium]